MVPNPTTTMNQQTIMTTQPSMSQDTDVTVVQDIDDTTTDIPMMLEAMGKGWLISECILISFRSSINNVCSLKYYSLTVTHDMTYD